MAGMVPVKRSERCSERTAELIDDEVRRLLSEAHERVRCTLHEKRSLLEKVAARLLEREVLNHDVLERLIADDQVAHRAGADARLPLSESMTELRNPRER
jgi:cell division protease FtsH